MSSRDDLAAEIGGVLSDDLSRVLGRMDAQREKMLRERDGTARQAVWQCEDGWAVVYTTTRIEGGKHDGTFAAQLFEPGKVRGRDALIQVDRRICSTRRARAVRWYYEHSPKAAQRHGRTS